MQTLKASEENKLMGKYNVKIQRDAEQKELDYLIEKQRGCFSLKFICEMEDRYIYNLCRKSKFKHIKPVDWMDRLQKYKLERAGYSIDNLTDIGIENPKAKIVYKTIYKPDPFEKERHAQEIQELNDYYNNKHYNFRQKVFHHIKGDKQVIQEQKTLYQESLIGESKRNEELQQNNAQLFDDKMNDKRTIVKKRKRI